MQQTQDAKLKIFDIGFSAGMDGPGQRMVVYLKGCNLHCPWCAAPESIAAEPQVLFYPRRARTPEHLVLACPHGAVYLNGGQPHRHPEICASCADFACLESCSPAFERVGATVHITEIAARAVRYGRFFGRRGGVTVGGGEPTLQLPSVAALLERLRELRIHTALETNGTCRRLPELFPVLDLLLIDLKHPDTARCRALTGIGNETALRNIRQRQEQGGNMAVRIPLVPGINDGETVLGKFAARLAAIGRMNVELIPFHRRGEPKWHALGRPMPLRSTPALSAESREKALHILRSRGLQVH